MTTKLAALPELLMKANGAVLWRGDSLIDGAPLIVIAVGLRQDSSNSKTGSMLQTYILRADLDPVAAVRAGADVSICGQCPHRGRLEPGQELEQIPIYSDGPHVGRTCYVNIGQGPSVVFRTQLRGGYPDRTDLETVGEGRLVRLGTYGDPAAVPTEVWLRLLSRSAGHTGYTHQWRTCDQDLRHVCMASADSVADATAAQAVGWRTFRVAMPCDAPRAANEAVCPASAEAGRKLQCTQCLACGGADGRRGSIVIQAHGGFAVMRHVNSRGVRPYFARQP